MSPFDGCPRRPTRTAQPAEKIRELLSTGKLGNGHTRQISFLRDERGAALIMGAYDLKREAYGRIMIFPDHGPMVKLACRHARSGIPGRVNGGLMVSTHGQVTVHVWSRVFPEGHGAVLFGRARPDGTRIGGPITLTGHELDALERGIDMLLSPTTKGTDDE